MKDILILKTYATLKMTWRRAACDVFTCYHNAMKNWSLDNIKGGGGAAIFKNKLKTKLKKESHRTEIYYCSCLNVLQNEAGTF